MEHHSVLEEGKCANSCVHEYKYLISNSLCIQYLKKKEMLTGI